MKNLSPGHVWGTCLLWALVLFFPMDNFGAEPPLWPLDLDSRYLTSNFMEYRSGRFHAGIDLKTETITGFAVRAVEDGYVQRIRATPFAYGRAVYVRGVSGRTYVYAHLARFNDSLAGYIEAARKVSGKYRVRLEFKKNQIPVKKGGILGLSGESGTGGPHLHFEVRDAKQHPLNPHAQGFSIPDTMAPIFHTLRVIPMAGSTIINRQSGAMVARASVNDAGAMQPLVFTKPLYATGPVAFSAKIVDHADVRLHKLEPWLLSVVVDGVEVYHCCNEEYSFSDNSLQRLEWLNIPAFKASPEIREHWLYNRAGNSLTGRKGGCWGGDGGVLSLGMHEVVFTAADFAGNETSVTLPLVIGSVEDKNSGSPSDSSLWQSDPVRVVVGEDGAGRPTHWLTPFGKGQVQEAGPFPVLLVLDAAQGDPVLAPTVLTNIPKEFTQKQKAVATSQGLRSVGKPVAYLAADWAIDAAVHVPTNLQKLVAKDVMAYRWQRGQWKPAGFVIKEKQPGGSTFPLSTPGIYGFFLDETPPILGLADEVIVVTTRERTNVHGITMPRWRGFPLFVEDRGSGIAPETIKAFLDGKFFVVEPDLPRDQMLIVLPESTTAGLHTLKIEVEDKVGNLVVQEYSLEVVSQP